MALYKLNYLLTYNLSSLLQHTSGPTHNKGHTRDVFITHRTASVSVCVDPPVMSDHSLITGQFTINAVYSTDNKPAMKRRWNTFDVGAFKQHLSSTDLVVNPPTNCSDFWRVTTVHFGSSGSTYATASNETPSSYCFTVVQQSLP